MEASSENTGRGILKKGAAGARLEPFLSPWGAWAYGVGTAIGWGSLVVTTSQYLLQGGPVGSVAGLVVGALLMMVIARNYSYMMNRYPDSGGSYTYVRHVLGHDYGFLIAWFLSLTYLSVFWANATSLPLFSRFFLGGFFKVGYLYTIFDYEVYAGEVALTMLAIAAVGVLCTRDKRIKQIIMIALAFVFSAGIALCFFAAMFMHGGAQKSFAPLMLGDKNAISQIVKVSLMTPWAFIGFESVSNSTEEFAFPRERSFKLLTKIVITTTLLYVMVTLLSSSAYPARYDSWFAYLSDLDNLSGIEGLPAFYAAQFYLGDAGLLILVGSLLALVITSLIGNIVALSRLFVKLGRDRMLPEAFADLNEKGTPQNSVLAITLVSLLVPLLGRTPIGWIVDITTIGAVIVYGLVSLAEWHIGRTENDSKKVALGGVGFVAMAFIGLATMLPSLYSEGNLARETYFLITVWSVLGFMYFRVILKNDQDAVYGNSIIVWVFLLALVLFTSTVWMQKADQNKAHEAMLSIQQHLEQNIDSGYDLSTEKEFIQQSLDRLNQASMHSSLIMVGMFTLAVSMMFSNYRFMRKRQEENERALNAARAAAYTDALTGVKNKNAYHEWEHQADIRISTGEETNLVVIVCDVNGLKFVNDTLGHAAGDEYIRQACHIVCRHFKHSPVYRIGGDEFVVVPHGEDLENYRDILATFDREVEGNIGTNRAVVSAGYSILRPGLDSTLHDVFERADARMYQRKMQLKSMGAATRE